MRIVAVRSIEEGEELTCDHGGYRRLPLQLMPAAELLEADHKRSDEVATAIKASRSGKHTRNLIPGPSLTDCLCLQRRWRLMRRMCGCVRS